LQAEIELGADATVIRRNKDGRIVVEPDSLISGKLPDASSARKIMGTYFLDVARPNTESCLNPSQGAIG
jgi:hypothetical protein